MGSSLVAATPRIRSSDRIRDPVASSSHAGRFRNDCRDSRGSWSPAAVNTPSCPDCARFAGSPIWRRRRERMLDVVVVGAGPAGVVAALRAADLGAKIALVTRDEFGGMAAND